MSGEYSYKTGWWWVKSRGMFWPEGPFETKADAIRACKLYRLAVNNFGTNALTNVFVKFKNDAPTRRRKSSRLVYEKRIWKLG